MATQGQIDSVGYSPTNAGWLISGWLPVASQLASGLPTENVSADLFGRSAISDAPVKLVFYRRSDMSDRGVGVVCLISGGAELAEAMAQITVRFGRTNFRMDRASGGVQLPEPEMIRHCRALLHEGFAGNLTALTAALRGDAYAGVSTVEALPDYVRIGIDDLITLRPEGVIVLGWMLAWPGTVSSMAVCSEAGTSQIRPTRTIATERSDVLDAGGRDKGFEDPRCGFMAYVDGKVQAGRPAWLKVETVDGQVAYTPIPDRRLRGMRAIRRILEATDVHSDNLRRAFDTVVGPACRSLNAELLDAAVSTTRVRFGTECPGTRGTIVIPLYNRLDYLEHQLATLACSATARSQWDILYVLDDPPRRQTALTLAESAHARFGIPFTLVILGENRGFASACNIGLKAAEGEYVCFLNSDVLPITADFADRLADRLESVPRLGIIGGLLLFEDGSVQHEGMQMRVVKSQGELGYPTHTRKGLRPRQADLEICEMITGACMVLRRDLADRLGGFDEGFIIGDFEDADLCTRIREEGLSVAVDHTVRLFHLERQSQADPDQHWRRNMTTYNAWRYEQRRQSISAPLKPDHATEG